MWVKNEIGDSVQPNWQDDTFTKIDYVGLDLKILYPNQELYCCNFSYSNDCYGYVIFAYHATDPSITNDEIKKDDTLFLQFKYECERNSRSFNENRHQSCFCSSTSHLSL